ncbi:aminodeoxychorismate synthase component I [Nocardia sp. XZ_19_385]|uniref:aminodeoxychorismate synthase component I n=1 Tax=Nocardia sp. XZ_19_385 TaxID=2769488 RepID=UPI001E52EAEC|nr:aminodeoxychorismate synthase component I [Nocardia sp. XZ_19_385]
MRTLLIDNYDSFTYNLYQLISEVNGVEPTVVRNDAAATVAELGLSGFDNVVVSPGPGRPDIERDIGISAAVIRETELPLLGVCLGHQGIVVAAGGEVGRAPAARHGYLDRVGHDQRDLFAGLPQDFTVVRYHSLCALDPLPDSLEITATTPDGVIMGVRHRTRPQWGVQFHPESIAGDYGATLLRNFAELSAAHRVSRSATRLPVGAALSGSASSPRASDSGSAGTRALTRGADSTDARALDSDLRLEAGEVRRRADAAVPHIRVPIASAVPPPRPQPRVASTPLRTSDTTSPSGRSVPGRLAAELNFAADDSAHRGEAGVPAGNSTDAAPLGIAGTGQDSASAGIDSRAETAPQPARPATPAAPSGIPAAERDSASAGTGSGAETAPQPAAAPAVGPGTVPEVRRPDRPADETPYRLGERGRPWQVRHLVIERAIDTEAAFLRLYRESRTAFWLDSEHVEPGLDRFSFLGDASGPYAEVVRYRVGDGAVVVETADGERRTEPGDVLSYLAGQLRWREAEIPDLPFDFACGYVGYLGYEVKADCGAELAHRSAVPDAQWIFADRLIVVDHVTGQTHLLALTDPGSEVARDATADWLRDTREALEALPTWANPPELEVDSDLGAVEGLLTRGREQYLADIAVCLDKLRAGESYEICLTDGVTVAAADSDGLDFYRTLRRCNPAPYAAYLRFDDLDIACSSPERFLKIDRARTVESKPIKGTAPRGATPAEDERLRRELASDPKTRAENLMIVDLLRNDLGRVCQIGSVHVPNLMATETYTTLHQLVSTVRGTLRADVDVIDCVRACFPGGSMTGAPKLRTMEIIDELETEARGVYSGTIGFLGLGGTADLNIVIRTAVRHDGHWRIGAGGAIVLDSDPDAEYHEVLLKAAATYRALRP